MARVRFVCVLQIDSVESFVSRVNTYLQVQQQSERLKGIMARIEPFEVTVSKHLSLYMYIVYAIFIYI